MNSVKTVVSKGEFARRQNRGPSAVSNWIAAGKISAEALIGKGNSAKIWVEQAEADLAASLDPSQQAIQLAPILSTAAPPETPLLPLLPTDPTPDAPSAPPTRPAVMTEREADLARRAKADANRAEYEAEAARRRLLIDEGKYVVAEDAARIWGRELARLMGETETFLFSTLAREIANAHGIDWKTLSVSVRESFRRFRADVSDDARKRREAIEGSPLNVDLGQSGRVGVVDDRAGDEAAAAGRPE